MPRTVLPPPMGNPLLPDVPNWAWHEYGMRVGFWRFLEVLGARKLKATFAVNGTACELYREACQAALEAGWEFMGHGFVQRPMHRVEDQGSAIRDTIAAIKAFTGKPPRGWESPGLTETDETLDLLAEAGIEYVADWVMDEQPVALKTRTGSMVSVPYTVEVNDVVISAVQQQPSDEILRRGRDQFDRLYLEGKTAPRVMAISIHPISPACRTGSSTWRCFTTTSWGTTASCCGPARRSSTGTAPRRRERPETATNTSCILCASRYLCVYSRSIILSIAQGSEVPTAGTETIEWQNGNTAKPDPFFILILNNPALERPEGSGHFVPDMPGVSAADRAALKKTAGYIFQNLFGLLPGQVDKVLGLSPHASEIRVVSMCIPTTAVGDSTALVAEDVLEDTFLLVVRREQAHAFVRAHGLDPDILFVVSQSPTHTRASAFGTTDDDARPGIAFTYDGWNLSHRAFHLVPGMSAVHTTVGGMTPVHEFGHRFLELYQRLRDGPIC